MCFFFSFFRILLGMHYFIIKPVPRSVLTETKVSSQACKKHFKLVFFSHGQHIGSFSCKPAKPTFQWTRNSGRNTTNFYWNNFRKNRELWPQCDRQFRKFREKNKMVQTFPAVTVFEISPPRSSTIHEISKKICSINKTEISWCINIFSHRFREQNYRGGNMKNKYQSRQTVHVVDVRWHR